MKKRYLKWKKPKRRMPIYRKGQQVIITDNTCGHGFRVGQVVTLTRAVFNDREWWELEAERQGTPCFYFHEENCKPYRGGKS